jgi:hypothetical protein
MRALFRNSSLTIALLALFAASQVGMTWAGLRDSNAERAQHEQPARSLPEYLASGDYLEATMENWESEFLQMFAFVVLTAFLFQRGSSESRTPGEPEDVDRDPRKVRLRPDTPWPVRRGGWVLRIYESSLSLALLLLFLVSFVLHAAGGAAAHSEKQRLHGGQGVGTLQYLGTARFWFESFQNWQSEFFSVAVLVVLTIFLRQRGSPQSKPVDAPHAETGGG